MTAPKPATTYNSLVDTVNVYMKSGKSPSELELRRIFREIEKLKKADPIEGWLVAGMISAWQWDAASTVHNTDVAVRIAPRDVGTLRVASRCLWNAGLYEKANALTERASLLSPRDPSILVAEIERNIAFGRLSKVSNFVKDATTMGLQLRTNYYLNIDKHVDALRVAGIEESRLEREAALAMEVLADHHVRIDSVKLRPWRDPENGAMHFSMAYVFYGTMEQELELEGALAIKLMDDPEWDPDRLSTEFEYEPYPQ